MGLSAKETRFRQDKTLVGQRDLDQTLNVIYKHLPTLASRSKNRHPSKVGKRVDFSPELQMSLLLPNGNYTQPIKTPL